MEMSGTKAEEMLTREEQEYYMQSHLLPPDYSKVIKLIPAILSYTFSFYLAAFLIRRLLRSTKSFSESPQNAYRMQNLIVCLVHSFVSSMWTVYLFVSPSRPGMRNDWMHFQDASLFTLLTFSCGYFIHDAIDLLRFDRSWRSVELLAHHAAALNAFLSVMGARKFLPFGATALLMEVNSMFLHLRSLLQMFGHRSQIVRWANLLTFVPFRFCVQLSEVLWIRAHQHEIHQFYYWCGMLGSIFFFCSNSVLFRRILQVDGWITRGHKVTELKKIK